MEPYWFWLCNLEGIWNRKIAHFIQYFGNPKAVYEATEGQLRKVKGIKDADIVNLQRGKNRQQLEKKWNVLRNKGIQFLSMDSKAYPDSFRHLPDAPFGLWCKGNLDLLQRTARLPVAAMVGTRNCSVYGSTIAKQIGHDLGKLGVIVVSGMARGIDAASHQGCLSADGNTIGILGCGVDICYPRENIELYTELERRGLLISEYPCGTRPNAWQFPMRNRLISGLADRVLIIEGKKKSGSLITADYALEQGKDVYVVPELQPEMKASGLSEGGNALIEEGARTAISAEDLLGEVIPGKTGADAHGIYILCSGAYIIKHEKNGGNEDKKNIVLEKEMEMVYSRVDLIPKEIDCLLKEVQMEPDRLQGILVQLQLMDLIEEPVRNYYIRK